MPVLPPVPPLPPLIVPAPRNDSELVDNEPDENELHDAPRDSEPEEPAPSGEVIEVVESVEIVEADMPVEPVEVVEPVEAAESEEIVESVEIIEPVEVVETVEPAVEEAVTEIDPVVLAEPVEADTEADTDSETRAPALALRGVTKQFGQMRAVDAIDLTIPAGSFFGLVGPNGAGKTTTLSMIAGLLRPDSGSIEVCGVDSATDPSRAKKLIGVLPDRLRTFDRLTGRQLLYYYGVLRGLSSSVVQSRIADLARAFDLVDALGRVVSDYSAGMTKKVMLAGAMIHSPRVLVLDEPFESLDPASSQVILDILETYVAHGGTVVLSSHGMALVERVCTRVAVLVEGEVLAAGTVDEVRGELTLEQRFVELSGGVDDAEGLEWLHTFSD